MTERLETAPIFLNCFSRGGSNILWNLFLSHPACCSPIEETIEIFYCGWRRPRLAGLTAALLSRQWRYFDQWWLAERRPAGAAAQAFVDRILYRRKLGTLADPTMRWKSPEAAYSRDEVERARLVAKNNNGLAFLAPELRRLYPDSSFVGLVRDPVALYESHKRRRIVPDTASFCRYFNRLGTRLADDAERLPGYAIVRFEDILERPVPAALALFESAGLPADGIEHLRFKGKPHLHPDGRHRAPWTEGEHRWLALSEVDAFFEPGIDRLQAARLDPGERHRVAAETTEVAERLAALAIDVGGASSERDAAERRGGPSGGGS